mmetsp:Transcript_44707/g.83490  ORF Transcript_44707/g.83490 Transcript_44707/m.83490 type:complete len:240 (-) Transcript_44707:267-986(-)
MSNHGAPVLDADPKYCWVPTEIQRCSDLVDGKQWIAAFEQHLKAEPRPTRQLRMTVSEGDNPQFWTSAGSTLRARNDALRKMQACARPVTLQTGHDVLFWFNIGPHAEKRDRVYVTDAKCPHQGICLSTGELKDVEDLGDQRRGMVRCPRHNKIFDLETGLSPGNCEALRVYPSKFHQGQYYVQVPSSEAGRLQQVETDGDIEMLEEPDADQLLSRLPPTPVTNILKAKRALGPSQTLS